jgi:hypothetical protein
LMNSRGTLISHRITGDTLAISDNVAMTPTVQPLAAGTQRSRERDWLRGRDAVRVTDGEDIRFSYGMPMFGTAWHSSGFPNRESPLPRPWDRRRRAAISSRVRK